jgi:deferrochelatase/peroxidase EfeB
MQEGIYFRSGESPPGFFAFVLLGAGNGANAASAGALLGKLWGMYGDLKAGKLRDLPGIRVPAGALKVLLGFGRRAFTGLEGVEAGIAPLLEAFHFDPPDQAIDGAIAGANPLGGLPCGIKYVDGALPGPANAHFALQFTAKTPLAVERAVVETWKLIRDEGDGAALELLAAFTGTQRDDGRSWIDFYDGLSNMSSDEREKAIAIGPDTDTTGNWSQGTYLGFVRLEIHLDVWRGLGDAAQERLVGRDKLNGCPVLSFDGVGFGAVENGCPVPGKSITARDNSFRNAPTLVDAGTTIRQTHVQRANQHVPLGPEQPESFRIYRQGYPFLEQKAETPGFRVGLNFVSFQNTPAKLIGMLTRETWLGATNFGGDAGGRMLRGENSGSDETPQLLSAVTTGMFLVPPRSAREPFPGARVLVGR